MDTALLIVIALAVAGLLLFVATRKKTVELPPEADAKPALSGDTTAKSGAQSGQAAAEATSGATSTSATGDETGDETAATATPEATADAPLAEAAEPSASETTESADAPEKVAEPEEPAKSAGEEAREKDVAALRKGLASTRGGFIARLAKLFGGKKEIDSGLLEEIEEVLITADVGVHTSQRILDDLRTRMESGELKDEESVWSAIRSEAVSILDVQAKPIELASKPAVVLVIGVNGVGKTTPIGKLASRYAAEGKRVLLAAGDTYRAAAVLQLEMWGKRVDCPVVRGKENADPGSVIFDAISKAGDEGYDLVIADTAGRLHTKTPLMDELKKVSRTVGKATDGRGADEVFLVLDSTTGQNAVQQMQMFREAMEISGVVLTKLDGTAKGGVILGIVDQHKVPVRFIGLGERVEDLREFDGRNFVEALFQKPGDETMAA
ncbi:MAG: signal recognition particle-docking protein FtsY [Myxococcales bacterium]|nr:signal recognition particle-docking protein FtsY [Myxococcales bacterium]